MSVRRWFCLLLATLCVMSCAGCTGLPTTSDVTSEPTASGDDLPVGPESFAVPYSNGDTLNPYAAKTAVNLHLATLLYTGLYRLDDGFTPQAALAAEHTWPDTTHVEITLKSGAVFSDGSAVTAPDVVASYNAARTSANYKVLLENVTRLTVNQERLVFTLKTADPNALACLTFPVYKASSATNAVGQAPIGAGPYMLTYVEDTACLQANPHAAVTPHYTTVGLRHIPNSESMPYGITSGNITYYYNDLNTGNIPHVTGASATVDMNALVFLGVNSARESVANVTVRQALSKLIDRRTLASATYAGWASAATNPFHPAWSAMKDIVGVADTADAAGATQLLKDAGYSSDKPLTLEIIYSQEGNFRTAAAERLRGEMESAGIRVTLTPLSYTEYKNRLAAGRYDLYIGEIRLTANMDLTPLWQYGVNQSSAAVTAYTQYRAGEITLAAFCEAFAADMPFIPLCWRAGFAAYDRRLATVTPHGYDPYYGIEKWQ